MLNAEVTFPAAIFWREERPHGPRQHFAIALDEDWFSRTQRRRLGASRAGGMRVIDSANRAWAVREIRSKGRKAPLPLAIIMTLLNQGGEIDHHAEYLMEETPATDFSEVRREFWRHVEDDPLCYVTEERVAGITGPQLDLDAAMVELRAVVDHASSLEELMKGLESFSRNYADPADD